MGKKIWLPMYPRNFGSHVTVRPPDRLSAPQAHQYKTRGNHRLKSAFDMRSELFPGGPQIFTGFYELVSREKKKVIR